MAKFKKKKKKKKLRAHMPWFVFLVLVFSHSLSPFCCLPTSHRIIAKRPRSAPVPTTRTLRSRASDGTADLSGTIAAARTRASIRAEKKHRWGPGRVRGDAQVVVLPEPTSDRRRSSRASRSRKGAGTAWTVEYEGRRDSESSLDESSDDAANESEDGEKNVDVDDDVDEAGAHHGGGGQTDRKPVDATLIDGERVSWKLAVDTVVRGVASSDKATVAKVAARASSAGLASLRVRGEANHIKMTPGRITSVALHATVHPRFLFFVGDKYGNVACWARDPLARDVAGGVQQEPDTCSFQVHRMHVHGLALPAAQPGTAITCSRDGTVRALDIERGISREWLALDRDQGRWPSIHDLAVTRGDSATVTYVSDSDGFVTRIDPRQRGSTSGSSSSSSSSSSSGSSSGSRWRAHGNKIGGIDISSDGRLLATASNDRTVRIWDLRALGMGSNGDGKGTAAKSPIDADFAPLAQHAHGLVAQSVAFSPTDPRTLASSSSDDTVRMWTDCTGSGSGSGSGSRPNSLRHNNQTGRWITNFRLEWSPHGTHLAIGGMRRTLDLISAPSCQLATQLSEGVTAIPALSAFHPSGVPVIASGNASGRAVFWT
jgi:hypothetical protein